MAHQVGLNSPMSTCSSTKAYDKKHVACVPNAGLPPFSPTTVTSACGEDVEDRSALKASATPAAKRRSKQIEDESLHRWSMQEAIANIAEQQAQRLDSAGSAVSSAALDAGDGGQYNSSYHKKDKEREYIARILSEAMQRHLRASSPPAGEVLPSRNLEMKGSAICDGEAVPHPLAGSRASRGPRHRPRRRSRSHARTGLRRRHGPRTEARTEVPARMRLRA